MSEHRGHRVLERRHGDAQPPLQARDLQQPPLNVAERGRPHASTLADRLNGVPLRNAAMKGEAVLRRTEATAEHKAVVGRLIARTFEIARMSNKQASLRMGLSDDGSQVARWIAGVEPPSLWRLVSVPALACGLSVALAELADAEVCTVIRIPQDRRQA